MSEASRKRALEWCTEGHQSWHTPECGQCANIAAALDEARAEGAERERWECWRAVSDLASEAQAILVAAYPFGAGDEVVRCPGAQECADAINARGPMRGPEEV